MEEIYKRIKELRIQQGLSQEDLAMKVGYKGKTMIAKIEAGGVDLSQSKIVLFATALHTTPSYLLDGSGENKSTLTRRDEKDIEKRLESTLSQLESQDALMFSGEPLDDATKELLRLSLENSLRIAKVNAKEKYTPKKYKDEK